MQTPTPAGTRPRAAAVRRPASTIALGVAALGILVQIAGGIDYPTVPPGLVILVTAALVCAFVPGRWVPVIGLLAAVFLLVGFAGSGALAHLFAAPSALAVAGNWVQLLGLLAAVVCPVLDLLRRR